MELKHLHSRKNRVTHAAMEYAITAASNPTQPLDELSLESNLQMLPPSTVITAAVIQPTVLVSIFMIPSLIFFNCYFFFLLSLLFLFLFCFHLLHCFSFAFTFLYFFVTEKTFGNRQRDRRKNGIHFFPLSFHFSSADCFISHSLHTYTSTKLVCYLQTNGKNRIHASTADRIEKKQHIHSFWRKNN